MALNRPFGLSPIRTGNGSPFNAQLVKYRVPSADGSQYSIGDPVTQLAGADANGVPNVAKSNGTTAVRGVICGIEVPAINLPTLSGNPLPIYPSIPAAKAGVDYYVLVVDDPDVIMMAQDDGITSGNLVAASANLNCSVTIANPAQPFQVSGCVLLSSSFAVTATLIVKLMGLVQEQAIPGGGPNAFGAYAVWVCKFNQHNLMGNQVGI
jgi:hypothetical protein